MIGYIRGKLTLKLPTHVYLETQGIGYHIHITLQTYGRIEHLEEACLYTVLIVREDSHTLYGFFSEEEKQVFQHLLSVSGVGSNTARIILSTLSVEDIRHAILTDHPEAFRSVKGVGPKTAKQIILDLKDKMLKTQDGAPEILNRGNNTVREEALSALVALGFVRQKAAVVLARLEKEHPEYTSVEQLIKAALGQLAS